MIKNWSSGTIHFISFLTNRVSTGSARLVRYKSVFSINRQLSQVVGFWNEAYPVDNLTKQYKNMYLGISGKMKIDYDRSYHYRLENKWISFKPNCSQIFPCAEIKKIKQNKTQESITILILMDSQEAKGNKFKLKSWSEVTVSSLKQLIGLQIGHRP